LLVVHWKVYASTRLQVALALLRLCRASGRAVPPLVFSSVGLNSSRCASGHYDSRHDYSSSRLHRLYCAYAVHPDAPSRCSTSRRSAALALAVRPVTASRGATTRRPDCTGSTAPMSCIRTRRLAARLLVDRPHWLSPCVWSLRLAARLLDVRIAPALLRLCRASGCAVSTLDFSPVGRTGSRRVPGHSVVRGDYLSRGRNGSTSPTPHVRVPRHVRGSSRRSSLTTSPMLRVQVPQHVVRLVVDYFAYPARLGASAHRTARRAARRQLLRLRCASGRLGTSRGSSHHSSSTTSPTPRIRVPRHVTRLVTRLVVDYSVRRDFVLRPHWLYFSHAVHRDYLSCGNTSSTPSTPRAATTSSSDRIASTTHLD
jgi:hypothetical protein